MPTTPAVWFPQLATVDYSFPNVFPLIDKGSNVYVEIGPTRQGKSYEMK